MSVSYIYQLEVEIGRLKVEKENHKKVCNLLQHDNQQLREKLKFYTEPFELRPTYQVLEKKLKKIEEWANEPQFGDNGYHEACVDNRNDVKEILGK